MTDYTLSALEVDFHTAPEVMADLARPLLRFMGPEALELSGRLVARALRDEVVILAVTHPCAACSAPHAVADAILTVERAGRALHVVTIAGTNVEAWLDDPLLAGLEELAREQGAEELSCIGRKGWSRLLGARGWRLLDADGPFVTMSREITADVRAFH